MSPTEDYAIKFVKLNNGEDLITEVVTIKKSDGEYHRFVNPLKIVYINGDMMEMGSSFSLLLIHWVFPRICDKQEFTVFPHDIVTMSKPTDDMIEYYYDALSNLDKMELEMKNSKPKKQAIKRKAPKNTVIVDVDAEEISEEEVQHLNEMMRQLLDNKRKLH